MRPKLPPPPGKPVKPGKPGRGKPEIDFGGKPKKGGFELTNPSKPAKPKMPGIIGMAKGGSASKGKKK